MPPWFELLNQGLFHPLAQGVLPEVARFCQLFHWLSYRLFDAVFAALFAGLLEGPFVGFAQRLFHWLFHRFPTFWLPGPPAP